MSWRERVNIKITAENSKKKAFKTGCFGYSKHVAARYRPTRQWCKRIEESDISEVWIDSFLKYFFIYKYIKIIYLLFFLNLFLI
jgi:hypothetical protein